MDHKNILILSDIHYGDLAHLDFFGNKSVSEDSDFNTIAQRIYTCLEDVTIDLIFVLGDLTSRGTPGEFEDFSRFLKILREKFQLNEDQVFVTYGNHDVDWNISKIDPLHSEHKNAYKYAAANIAGLFVPSGKYTYSGPVLGCGVAQLDGIDLISLNSGVECYNSQEIKHGKLGTKQFNWVKNELSALLRCDSTKIVVLHHHLSSLPYKIPIHDLSALEEGPNVLEALGQYGIDIVMHGHRHHPIIHTKQNSNWSKPITFFCAGSFGVSAHERASGRLPNTFHLACIKPNKGASTFDGYIKTYELDSASNWIPLSGNSSECPINHIHWFGDADASTNASYEVNNILNNLRSSISAIQTHTCLPDYDNLPLPLKCLQHSTLNKILCDESTKIGLVVTGEYPKKCILTELEQ